MLVGTLNMMALHNEMGIVAVTARTQDIDLARRQPLQLGAPLSLLATRKGTSLGFLSVPGFPAHLPSSTASTSGCEGLRVDWLVPGPNLGEIVAVPELKWSAQTIPYFQYLLDRPERAWMLAGSHCIPIRLPQAVRMVWHKLYSSTQRHAFREKAQKDFEQAPVLGSALSEQDPSALRTACEQAPAAMLHEISSQHGRRIKRLEQYLQFQEIVDDLLGPLQTIGSAACATCQALVKNKRAAERPFCM